MEGTERVAHLQEAAQEVADTLAMISELCALTGQLHISTEGTNALEGMLERSRGKMLVLMDFLGALDGGG